MKENKKNIILTILMIIIITLIVVITILFIMQRINDTNTDEIKSDKLINHWVLYKQDIIQDNELIDIIDKDNINDVKLNIKENSVEACYIENEEEKCDTINYTYNGNTLVILEGSDYISGIYKVTFEDNFMILETRENENNIKLKNYLIKTNGK